MSVKVCFRMYAYNSEKYIEKTLDSIIAQTDGNWILYLINHGSTDNTGKICEEYAQKDDRIIYFHIKENYKPTEEEIEGNKKNREDIAKKEVEYYSVIDSDDYLAPNFVETMYKEAKESDAEVICCGTSMFADGEDGKYVFRKPVACEIINNLFTEEQFRKNYGTLRTFWGKLYSSQAWLSLNDIISNKCKVKNGMDTYCVLTLLIESIRKLKFIEEPMYFYRVRNNSYYSSKPDKQRCYEGGVLLEVGKKLANKANILDYEITGFLHAIYFNHVRDLLEMLNKENKMTLEEKIDFLEYAFEQKEFREAYNYLGDGMDSVIRGIVTNLTNDISDTQKCMLMRSYVMRMYSDITVYNYSKFNTVWRLSILCDSKNILNWGNDDGNKINAGNKNKIIEIINSPLTKEHNKEKQDLLIAIEDNDIEKSNKILDSLLETRLLDREGLYFKMYIDAVNKKYCSAIVFAEIARVFWGEDEDIASMINMVYAEVEKVSQSK